MTALKIDVFHYRYFGSFWLVRLEIACPFVRCWVSSTSVGWLDGIADIHPMVSRDKNMIDVARLISKFVGYTVHPKRQESNLKMHGNGTALGNPSFRTHEMAFLL